MLQRLIRAATGILSRKSRTPRRRPVRGHSSPKAQLAKGAMRTAKKHL